MKQIKVKYNHQWYRFNLTQLPQKDGHERWKIWARNGELVLSNNRPLLLRKGLKHWAPTWKVEVGSINSRSFTEALIDAVEKVYQDGTKKPR